ncbi:hypothetical protein HDU82_002522, partial [Entophlyctis luteolus]
GSLNEVVDVLNLVSRDEVGQIFSVCKRPYLAITHTWGAVSNLYDELSPIYVTRTRDLSKLILLQHLRSKRNAWIDVYDNVQSDSGKSDDLTAEQKKIQSAQINIMGEVYFYAEFVLWLTSASDDQTLTLLEEIPINKKTDNKQTLNILRGWAAANRKRILSWSQPENRGFEHWTRAWTYQEIANARELHAVSPYTNKTWDVARILEKCKLAMKGLHEKDDPNDSEEVKRLRSILRCCRSDLELVSQGRNVIKTGLDPFRISRELQGIRYASYARDVLFTHRMTLGIPNGLLDYSKPLEWNIRTFCAFLIANDQMPIASNPTSPIPNACWILPEFFDLLQCDAQKAPASTSILKSIRAPSRAQQVRLTRTLENVSVLENGMLQMTTYVKELYGDIWLAFINERQSVVFSRTKCHILAVADSKWHSTTRETVSFGSAGADYFYQPEIVQNTVLIQSGANMLENLGWQNGIGWTSSADAALEYLVVLCTIVDDTDVYGIIKHVISAEDGFDSFNDCVLEAIEFASFNGLSDWKIYEAVEIIYALCGGFHFDVVGKTNSGQFRFLTRMYNDTFPDERVALKIYQIAENANADVVAAFEALNSVRRCILF